jgi:hypothetical protein
MFEAKGLRRWLAGAVLLAVAAGGTVVAFTQRKAEAAVQNYSVTFKGLIHALDGTKVRFVAVGTGSVDIATGDFSYDVAVPELEQAIAGVGVLGTGPKVSYGRSSFDSGTWQGTAIIQGKFSRETARFRGKIVVGIPNHFGPAPNGFTYTTGTIQMDALVAE